MVIFISQVPHMESVKESYHLKYMEMAVAKARRGIMRGQTPFGSCIVRRDTVLSCAHNQVWGQTDITAHAEIQAPRKRFHCDYAKQYTAVKWRWNLKVNKAERTKLRRTMKGCGDNSIIKPHRADIDKKGSGGGGGGDCDPNYSGACIPIVNHDLDCSDIPDRNFRVIGRDIHNFDGDGDGIACES